MVYLLTTQSPSLFWTCYTFFTDLIDYLHVFYRLKNMFA